MCAMSGQFQVGVSAVTSAAAAEAAVKPSVRLRAGISVSVSNETRPTRKGHLPVELAHYRASGIRGTPAATVNWSET
jgi:hypothetical protein